MDHPVELYSTPLCPFAHRTRLTLAEKGMAVRVVDLDLTNKPAWFVALAPAGEVPVLKVGGDCVWDCAVIDEYLEQVTPEPPLLPANAMHRARVRAWIRFADRRLYANTKRLLVATDADSRGAAMVAVREDLRFMQLHAFGSSAAGPYWTGDRFTLADVTFIPWFEQSLMLERLLGFTWPEESGGLRRWYAHVSRRPTVVAEGRPGEFYLHEYGKLMRDRAPH